MEKAQESLGNVGGAEEVGLLGPGVVPSAGRNGVHSQTVSSSLMSQISAA